MTIRAEIQRPAPPCAYKPSELYSGYQDITIASASYLGCMVLSRLSQDGRMGGIAFAYYEILLSARTDHTGGSRRLFQGAYLT